MTLLSSKQVADNRPSLAASQAGDTKVVPFDISIEAALANGDILELCKLPAQHVAVDCLIVVPDLDSDGSPAIVFDAGFYENDGGVTAVDVDNVIDASDAGQAGGLARPNAGGFLSMAVSNNDRIFAMTITVDPATGATSGTIRGWLLVRPAGYDD